MMKTINDRPIRRKYDADLKARVLEMIANGQPVTQVAQASGIGENLIYKRKNARRQASEPSSQREKNHGEVVAENERLKGKTKQMELGQAVLKKALAIFSRQT